MNALLTEALQAFGLTHAEFIQQHENAVYRADGHYLLRIHKAAEGLHVDHDPALRRAELALLTHLADAGMPVQRPLAETTLSDGTQATLLTWLEGRTLTRSDMPLELLQQAGELAFRLHQAAQGFPHEGLRRYDAAHVLRLADAIAAMGTRHALNREESAVACAAARVIADRLAGASGEFLAIHCDLSASNLLLTEQGLAVIDFSLCGAGHPMHDLGILLGNIGSQAERQAIAAGYAAAGGRIDLPLLDAGYTLGLLEALDFHADVWPQEPWFAPRLTRWVSEQLRPLAEGKPLLNEDMFLLNIK